MSVPIGGLMQVSGAFVQVQSAMAFIVMSYPLVARLCATINRMKEFEECYQASNNLRQQAI